MTFSNDKISQKSKAAIAIFNSIEFIFTLVIYTFLLVVSLFCNLHVFSNQSVHLIEYINFAYLQRSLIENSSIFNNQIYLSILIDNK